MYIPEAAQSIKTDVEAGFWLGYSTDADYEQAKKEGHWVRMGFLDGRRLRGAVNMVGANDFVAKCIRGPKG